MLSNNDAFEGECILPKIGKKAITYLEHCLDTRADLFCKAHVTRPLQTPGARWIYRSHERSWERLILCRSIRTIPDNAKSGNWEVISITYKICSEFRKKRLLPWTRDTCKWICACSETSPSCMAIPSACREELVYLWTRRGLTTSEHRRWTPMQAHRLCKQENVREYFINKHTIEWNNTSDLRAHLTLLL